MTAYVEVPQEWRGTTDQVCGLWPFAAGAGSPMVGVPTGRHLTTSAALCCDPISWFQRAGLISNPSAFVLSLPGLGKALDVDTVVPTPSGWATMGDLKAGDEVFDEHGQPTRVVAVSDVLHDRECFELRFSDGARVVADADHLWRTETRRDRTRDPQRIKRGRTVGTSAEIEQVRAAATGPALVTRRALQRELGWFGGGGYGRIDRASRRQTAVSRDRHGSWFDRAQLVTNVEAMLATPWGAHNARRIDSGPRTTRAIADTVRIDGDDRANHAIPVAPPLQIPDRDLPIAPRLLGLWLGDGHSRSARFTTTDPELTEEFGVAGYPVRYCGNYLYSFAGQRGQPGGLQRALRALGVLGDKHIPLAYLRGSVSQRRALLSGLLDTDGTVHPDGMVQYTSTNERLAHDVHALACSLGYRACLYAGRARLNGRDVGPAWTIGFTTSDVVFGLDRKRRAHAERHRGATDARTRLRYITAVTPVPSRPVRCIQVENESGMFLVGRECIATHNSTLIRRWIIGLADRGVIPLVVGDLKPDHVTVIQALGGDVIRLGRGRGYLNVLDASAALAAADRLTGQARGNVIADARGRRLSMVSALITILRAQAPAVDEELLLERAIALLDERHPGTPVLPDLIRVLHDAPPELRELARDRGDLERYRDAVEPLIKTLTALLGRGRVGEMFAGQTTTPMRRDVPTVFDLSSIPDDQPDLQRAALVACWGVGFGAVEVGHVLADNGLERRRYHFIVMDEVWRVLRGGRGMVDRVDNLSRLNRTRGVGQVMISHTLADLQALPDEDDRHKARGLVERAGMVVCGGLPEAEMPGLGGIVGLSRRERELLTSWVSPPSWDTTDQTTEPPGRGLFLIKVGGRPGLPFRLELTDAERSLENSSARWQ